MCIYYWLGNVIQNYQPIVSVLDKHSRHDEHEQYAYRWLLNDK